MTYEITYNGFGSDPDGDAAQLAWQHLQVREYTSVPHFAEDGQTHITTIHSISGTALLNSATNVDIMINNARSRLSKIGRRLEIYLGPAEIVDVGNDDYDTVDGLASPYSTDGTDSTFDGDTDLLGYPRCDFQVNKFYGDENAMISFSFQWAEMVLDEIEGMAESDSYSILGHHWRQSFSIKENQLQTWTVNGFLHVRSYTTVTGDEGVNLGRNPDSYRGLVMPSIPSNFRVKNMEWATDESGEKLMYTLVFQEHARRLPAPATVGKGTFTFRKSIDSDAGLLGIKVFDGELSGHAHTNTPELLAALLNASSKRITWTGQGRDLITSIEIKEREIFSKKIIGLRVTAKGTDVNSVKALQGGEMGDLNFGILNDFVGENDVAKSPSPWGVALISSYKRQFFIPYAGYTIENFPKAQIMGIGESDTTLLDGSTMNPNTQGDYTEVLYGTSAGGLDPTPPPTQNDDLTGPLIDDSSKDDDTYHYIKVKGIERMGIKNNIIVLNTYGISPQQIPWTIGAPDIFLESEYTITRMDVPPPMLNFRVPTNGIVLDEQTSVDAGEVDSNGHRMFTRHLNRKIQILWGVGTGPHSEEYIDHWFYIGNTSVQLTFQYPVFYSGLHRPFDPRFDSHHEITTSTIFNGPTTDEVFPIEFSVPLGTG